jgi:hypothetical protein
VDVCHRHWHLVQARREVPHVGQGELVLRCGRVKAAKIAFALLPHHVQGLDQQLTDRRTGSKRQNFAVVGRHDVSMVCSTLWAGLVATEKGRETPGKSARMLSHSELLLLNGEYVAADRLRQCGAGKELLCTDVYHQLEVAHKVYSQDGNADVGEQELVLQQLAVSGDRRRFPAPAPDAHIVRARSAGLVAGAEERCSSMLKEEPVSTKNRRRLF